MMDSAFYSCVDDTIEDTFDASSDTELADSDVSVGQLSHTQRDSDRRHPDIDRDARNCNKTADWLADSRRERSSKDNILQGNSAGFPDSRKLPTTGNLWRHESSVDNKCSLTASDNVQLNSNLSATDIYNSESSRQRNSRYHENVYVNKCDTVSSRRSLLKSKTHTETAESHFQMSTATLPSCTNRLDNTVFLPDDKVMEIVEEQLENDDDDGEDDDGDDDDDVCMVTVKRVTSADDEDEVDSDVDDSEVDEVEEISEDDEDRLADEEKAVLVEAARAAAEAEASSSAPAAAAAAGDDESRDKTAANCTADESVKTGCPLSTSDTPCEQDEVKKKKKKRRKLEAGETKKRKSDSATKSPRKKRQKQERNETDAKKTLFERRNIRKILEDDNLDEETKAAQKEEMERRKRLQEIQEKLRQQAAELRAQREKEMMETLEQLKNSALKSLLDDKTKSPTDSSVLSSAQSKPSKAPADVVEISSSEDEDEDNDLIMMASDAELEDEDDDEADETENSGSHVNDALNQRDAMGGVLVNVGHPASEQDIFLAPQLATIVKPHQIGGIRFLYDNLVESLDRFKTSNGLGCILAHSMGLGKTLQVVSFIDVFLRHTGAKSVLVIVPVNTLQNWVSEFNMWLPVASAVTGVETESCRSTAEGQTQSSTATGDAGHINRDMNSMSVNAAASADDSMVVDSGSRFSNSVGSESRSMFTELDSMNAFFNSESSERPNCPINFATTVPVSANCPVNPMVLESANEPSNSMVSEPRAASSQSEENLSSVPEIDRELFWPRDFKLYIVNDYLKTNAARAKVAGEWRETGGVLLLGYEMYRLLTTKRVLAKPRRAASKKTSTLNPQTTSTTSSMTSTAATCTTSESVCIDLDEEDSNKELLKGLHEALTRPGPDLVICDEGHRIKNSHASISQALKNIRTKRRVVLTGYPLQNNLLEYWCMVDFVRPNYLGTRTEFCNMFERPIMNGQCKDSTPEDIKLMRFRSHVLHSLLEGFVQRRGHAVLRAALPHKEEYVILVRMSAIQRQLYNAFMTVIKDGGLASWANSNNPIKAFSVFCKIWNHPDILHQIISQRKDDNDLDIDDAKTADVAAAGSAVMSSSSARRSRAKTSRMTSVVSSSSLMSSVSTSRLTSAASSDSLLSTSSVLAAAAVDSSLPATRLSAAPSTSSLMSVSGLHTTPSTDSMMSEASRAGFDAGKFDFTGMKSELTATSTTGSIPPGSVPGPVMPEMCQPSSDLVKFTTGHAVEFATPYSSNGGAVDVEPLLPVVDLKVGTAVGTADNCEDWVLKNLDQKSDQDEVTMKTVKDEVMTSEPDTKTSLPAAVSQGVSETQVSMEVKPDSDKPDATGDAVVTSNVTSSSSAAAAGSEVTTVASASDLKKESQAINYDWAFDLMKDYMSGVIEHSGKMVVLMEIIEQCIMLQEKILIFSQSLFTLGLIEEYLAKQHVPGTDEMWTKNKNYFRLDGSTSGLERERLINLFNAVDNNQIRIFLLSTRAGCLGINLVGASRVVVFDASWNPCHDCQAVCRVYRYGQGRCCFVYRLVTDNTMEKNIYDRQINKQGISDRIVDELNPQNLLERKQVDMLLRYEDTEMPTISPEGCEEKCSDPVLVSVVKKHHGWITKEPFTHESLLLDQQDQKLTKREKRLAQQGYENDKKMSLRPSYYPRPFTVGAGVDMSRTPVNVRYGATVGGRPVASVRPMMSTPLAIRSSSAAGQTRLLIPAGRSSSGLKPGVSLQQIQTTTDIIIPGTNTATDAGPNKIPAGEKVLVIKTPKGVYIRTNQGKIFAVRTTPKTSATSTASSTSSSSVTTVARSSQATMTTLTNSSLSSAATATTTGAKVTDGLSGKPGDAVIRTSTSGPVVISRGGTSRVPVVRPLITSGASRSRIQSSVIRTTLSRGAGGLVTSTKATRHVIPAVSVASRPSPSSSLSSQLVSASRHAKTATVTRVDSSSKLVAGRGSVSLIQVRAADSDKVIQSQKVVPGQKVAPVHAKSTSSSVVAMIDPQPVKSTTFASSSSLAQSATTSLRPLRDAAVAHPDASMSSVEPVQGGTSTQMIDRLGEFDGLLTSALEDLDDIGGHSALDDFSRPIAPAGPVRGGHGDMPIGYGYTGMDRQFQHSIPMQNPYLSYGMPPPPPAYPWIPPAMNVNPLWMQQPMGGQPMAGPVGSSQPMIGQVGGSAGINRSSIGDSFLPADNFDLSDAASFEPLGGDVNRSLTSLLADSEPPGFDVSLSRRNGTPGYLPSYPGPPMMSGYHPYHPYPMPYSVPHPPQKSHYYPPPLSANTQFCSPPVAGSAFVPPSAGYFPMHYPAAMPGPAGLYPGSGGGGYMQPGSAMIPAGPSYGLPGHGIAPPTAGESLTEFLMKNE